MEITTYEEPTDKLKTDGFGQINGSNIPINTPKMRYSRIDFQKIYTK